MTKHPCYTKKIYKSCPASRSYIEQAISYLGVPEGMKGYCYLCRAIEMACVDLRNTDNFIGGLYFQIADENRVSVSCVERDIRTAIKYIQSSGRLAEFDDYFRYFPKAQYSLSAKKIVILISERIRGNTFR